jgi:hypothetical protein
MQLSVFDKTPWTWHLKLVNLTVCICQQTGLETKSRLFLVSSKFYLEMTFKLSIRVSRMIQNGDWDTDTDCVSSVNQAPCWDTGDTHGWGTASGELKRWHPEPLAHGRHLHAIVHWKYKRAPTPLLSARPLPSRPARPVSLAGSWGFCCLWAHQASAPQKS